VAADPAPTTGGPQFVARASGPSGAALGSGGKGAVSPGTKGATMWAFFSRRLRMWLILAIGAPIVAFLLGKVGDVIESRRGPNAVSKVLKKGSGYLRNRTTGPLARRGVADTAGTRDAGVPVR
jgi:hypothetical protein